MARLCSSQEHRALCWVGSFRTICVVDGLPRLSNYLRRRRLAEANVLTCLAGCAFATPFALLFPLASTPEASLMLLAGMNFFAGFPFAGGYAALQELAPNRMRAQAVAVLLFAVNLVGGGFGPTLVALFTDYLFQDALALPHALSLSAALTLPVAVVLLVVLMRYNRSSKE
jgi:MFS family permease